MKINKKKLLGKAVVVLASVLVMTGGAVNSIGTSMDTVHAQEKTTIEFWHSLSGANLEAINLVIEDYNASQDQYTVNATFQGNYDEMSSKLQQSVASGDAPDISMIGYGYVGDFQAAAVLEDLSPYFEQSGIDKADFIEGLMLESFYDDTVVTIPFNRSTPILHINQSLFEEEGLEIPTTWDEFSEVTNSFVQKDGDEYARYGSVMQKDTWFKFSMISQFNSRFYNEEGTGFDFVKDGTGKKVFSILKDLQSTGALYYSSNADAYEDTLKTFLSQRAPIAFISSAASLAIERSEPTFDYTTAILPAGDSQAVATGGGNMAIMATSDNKEPAWNFVEWLIKDEKGATAFTIRTGYLPITYSMTENQSYEELYAEKPYRKTAFEQLEYAIDTTINPKHSIMLTEFYGAIEAIMYDSNDIDETLQRFEQNGEEILNN